MKGKVNGGQLCAERGDHFRWDFPLSINNQTEFNGGQTVFVFLALATVERDICSVTDHKV